jgi:hypothetical protein
MSAATIIQKARDDGLSLAVTERDTIKVIGPRVAAKRWAPELVANKLAILAELRQTGAPLWPAPRIKREEPFGLDRVPERYLAAWQSLLSLCPASVGPFVWEVAKHDAAILFGDFGRLLGEYKWAPGDLFDVPHDGSVGRTRMVHQGQSGDGDWPRHGSNAGRPHLAEGTLMTRAAAAGRDGRSAASRPR